MTVYRITNASDSSDLSGAGAKLMGGRWNSKGIPVLYTAGNISLAVLEMLVNTNFKDYSIALDLIYIKLPDQKKTVTITPEHLKKNWQADHDYTRFIGDEFFKEKESLVIKLPSAVVPEENNYLVNPLHPDFIKIRIIKIKSFRPDERLFAI